VTSSLASRDVTKSLERLARLGAKEGKGEPFIGKPSGNPTLLMLDRSGTLELR